MINREQFFAWRNQHYFAVNFLMAGLLVLLMAGVYALVYVTGGIKFVYSHSMYIPILLGGFIFGIKGGIIVGLVAGVVLGPFMPINVATGEMQVTANWLYRTGFFALIGFFSGVASDSAKSHINHLKWLSRHNEFSKLPNRSALLDKLAECANNKHAEDSYVLVVIEFENANELKSAFGFAVIDAAVLQLAERFDNIKLHKNIYHTDTAQLAILLNNDRHLIESEKIELLLHELTEVSSEAVFYNDIQIHIDTHMGYVAFSAVTEKPEIYLQRAEAALTVAHEKAQDSVAFSPAMLTITEENLSILGELKEAVNTGQLSLYYQPKIAIATGDVHGAEALMRWHHPSRGPIPPGVFIPRAEQSTLIQMITEFALDKAMAQIEQWRDQGIDVPIAVNISTRNLLKPGFTEMILRLLDQHNLSGDAIELEVTEGALMLDMDRTIDELTRLAGARMIISIDDFGTGYSSLQYLHRLPTSLIKIDQSFVRRLLADKDARHIVSAAVTLAHNMGMKALAEGVENQGTLDFLEDIGCDIAQGFMISRPLAPENFALWHQRCHGSYRYVH